MQVLRRKYQHIFFCPLARLALPTQRRCCHNPLAVTSTPPLNESTSARSRRTPTPSCSAGFRGGFQRESRMLAGQHSTLLPSACRPCASLIKPPHSAHPDTNTHRPCVPRWRYHGDSHGLQLKRGGAQSMTQPRSMGNNQKQVTSPPSAKLQPLLAPS